MRCLWEFSQFHLLLQRTGPTLDCWCENSKWKVSCFKEWRPLAEGPEKEGMGGARADFLSFLYCFLHTFIVSIILPWTWNPFIKGREVSANSLVLVCYCFGFYFSSFYIFILQSLAIGWLSSFKRKYTSTTKRLLKKKTMTFDFNVL